MLKLLRLFGGLLSKLYQSEAWRVSMESITVLITGAGAPGAPGVIKSLRDNGERSIRVVGVDASKEAVGFKLVDAGCQIPKADAPDFTSSLLKIAGEEKVDVILPLVTMELETLSLNKDKFQNEGIIVSVSDIYPLKIANNKGKLLAYMKDKGLSVSLFSIVNSKIEFMKSAYELGYPDKPICFKPLNSNGSRGFRIIDPKINRHKLLFDTKPTLTYITFDEVMSIFEESEIFIPLILMEYLPGNEYSVDLLVDHGRPLYTIPRRRDAMSAGITTKGVIIKEDDVINYCNEIVQNLKLHGNIGIQVKRDMNNIPLILEINPRIQGSIVHCTGAGVNLPYYAVKLALKEEVPKVCVKWNCKMLRYWKEVFY
ncbi:MAG: ATP-grasp domain-containing protein [Anaerolineaceae bacterium]|nr:MAG: ATP-grasp domain-containing protein [Anaerolineaceae bacterium]